MPLSNTVDDIISKSAVNIIHEHILQSKANKGEYQNLAYMILHWAVGAYFEASLCLPLHCAVQCAIYK